MGNATVIYVAVLESLHMLLLLYILYCKIKKFIKEKNLLDFSFLLVVVLTACLGVYNAYLNCLFASRGHIERVYIGNIEISWIMGFLCSALYFWFLLNLLKAKRWYSLPFVASFYLIIYGYFTPAPLLFQIYIAVTFIPGSIALIVDAIKRKHGLSFSIGVSVVLFLFTEAFISPQFFVLYYSLEYVLLIVLLLGVTGWWDRNVFYDREYANKIKNTWIAHRIGS